LLCLITIDFSRALFNYLWPKALQKSLDSFKTSWNETKRRTQSAKLMPSGCTPFELWHHPELYDGKALGIRVRQEHIDSLRADLQVSRKEAFRWVSDEFEAVADNVYAELGSPLLTIQTAWEIFSSMLNLIEARFHADPLNVIDPTLS
jgi:hypothetical protein